MKEVCDLDYIQEWGDIENFGLPNKDAIFLYKEQANNKKSHIGEVYCI